MYEDAYLNLREFLDLLPGGYPETPNGLEMRILRKLFTPQEAEMAMRLTLGAEMVSEISARCGMEETEAAEMLESMAKKGLIYRERSGEEVRYQAASFVVGIYEFQLNTIDEELAGMVEDYLPYIGMLQGGLDTKQLRVVPVAAAVDATPAVASYDRIRELMREQEIISVSPCVCRKEKSLVGKECSKPMDACIGFGSFAQYYIDNGMGRRVALKEALEILDQAEEAGAVLATLNSQNLRAVCCCCSCCCGFLAILKLLPAPAAILEPAFSAAIDAELCTACGICLERCQMDAIVDSDGIFEVDAARCIGCGLCLSRCPDQAVAMTLNPAIKPPPQRFDDTLEKIVEERAAM